ncbi:AAA family ATPase [Georgenia sp. SUBG003]|uniref:AAA family ATPase n=1 Tax=Georgenia sp. SUBG003 TaxID=1497974 RepID=UPI003AB87DDA
MIGPNTPVDRALDFVQQFGQHFPTIVVVLVSDGGHEVGLAALRAGVRDILPTGADRSEIRGVLDRASLVAQTVQVQASGAQAPPEPGLTGRIISVVSPKGGVGKTTTATNLAVGLARAEPHSTVIVDLDVQFGDVATALNLAPEYSLLDAVHGPAARDTMALKTFLSLHPTGLYAICAPDSPAAADGITAEEVGHLLRMLASQFRYVVVDTAPGLSEHTLAALDHASDLVLITSMDVAGVRGLRKELDILGELGMGAENRVVVLNFCTPRGGLSVADVKATIGRPVDIELPVSSAVLPSLNQGVPLLQTGGKDPIVKQFHNLVSSFAPVATPNEPAGRRAARSRRKATVAAR